MEKHLLKGSKFVFLIATIFIMFVMMSIFSMECNAVTSDAALAEHIQLVALLSNKKTKTSTFLELCEKGAKSGNKIKTSGYASAGDGGAATYLIDSNPGEGSVADIPINGGLYAHLQYSGTVNVASIGILPGAECSEAINSAVSFFAGKASTLKFNDGVYYFSKQLFLSSINLTGSNRTVFCVTSDFDTNVYRIFLTDIRKSDVKYDIGLSRITFLLETSKNHSLHDKPVTLMSLSNISSCSIKNCNFIARKSAENGDFMACNLLWFEKYSNCNTVIDNCKFQNLTGENEDINADKTLSGGCIWFSGQDTSTLITGVTIKNCNIETTLTDEAVAFWNCTCKNVAISNCDIRNYHFYSHNVLSVYHAAVTNMLFDKCHFIIDSPASAVMKIFNITDTTDIGFKDCIFDINSEAQGKERVAIIYTNDHGSAYVNSKEKTISFDGCSFNSKANDKYNYLLCIYQANKYNFPINNCKINAGFSQAVVNAGNSTACKVDIRQTPIDEANNPVVSKGFENCEITIN